jgi:two-component system sensor histidine kinase AlgZ
VSSAVLRCDPTPVGDRITFEDDRDELRLFGSSPRKLATLRRCYDVLMESRLEWRGLWHPTARPRWWLRLVVYVIVPLVLVLLVGDLRRFGAKYLGAFIVSVAISASFELAYLAWQQIVRRRPSWPARLAGHAVTTIAAVGAGCAIAALVNGWLLGWHDVIVRLWMQGGVLATALVAILVFADELVAREAESRVAALRAELSALQARTDPHFLFNSLNAVAALIPTDPGLAELSLERLAVVFRYALYAGRCATVELVDELDAVTAYLEVEALRFGARLRWQLECEPGIDAFRVPPLVLQPLVENAIRHGASGRRGATDVAVSVHRRGDELVLAVEDRGEPVAQPSRDGAGVSLADLRARLALAYNARARLAAGAATLGWRAEVVLPVEGA